jgi:Aspartic acid proteinase inhibitor
MKKNWRVVMIVAITIAVLGSFAGISSGAWAQKAPIVGAYADTSNADPEAVAAARFAIKAERQKLHGRLSLVSIKHAEVQVVSGFNYRLCMRVKVKGRIRNVKVVVYKNLKQKYSLTSWSANGCRE